MNSRFTGGLVLLALSAATGTPGTWLHAQRPAVWTVEPEVWLTGKRDARSPAGIAAIASDVAGRIYVFDQRRHELRVFDRAGSVLGTFNGEGNASNDFDGVAGVAVGADGNVWLVNGKSQQYVSIRDGTVRTFARASPMWRAPWWGGIGNDGSLYDPVVLPGSTGEALLRIDTRGRVTDTIRVSDPGLLVPRRGAMEFPLPYGARVLRAFDPRGFIWQAVSDQFRIVKLSWGGDTVAVISRPERASALTKQQRDSVGRYASLLSTEMQVDVLPAHVPRVAPLLQWMVVDDRGCLWISVVRPPAPAELHVFDPRGRHIARVRSPLKLTAGTRPAIRGDRLYALADDSTGASGAVQARIRGRR